MSPPAASARRPARRPRRAVGWRRVLAALLAALVVAGLTRVAVARPAPGSVPVVVATDQVAVGSVLTAGLLEVRHLPRGSVPEGALSRVEDAVDQHASTVLSSGEVLTRHDLSIVALLDGQPPGTVAVWLPLPDGAVAAALSAGARVDLHSPVDGQVVVADTLVLSVQPGRGPPAGVAGVGGVVAGGAGPPGGEPVGMWVALDPGAAVAVAAARGADPSGAPLLVALRGRGEGTP
jgi:hypothetical protein